MWNERGYKSQRVVTCSLCNIVELSRQKGTSEKKKNLKNTAGELQLYCKSFKALFRHFNKVQYFGVLNFRYAYQIKKCKKLKLSYIQYLTGVTGGQVNPLTAGSQPVEVVENGTPLLHCKHFNIFCKFDFCVLKSKVGATGALSS